MIATLQGIMDNIPSWLAGLTTILTSLNVMATMTKNQSDNRFLNKVLVVINFLSFNFGRSKNQV